MIRRRTMRSNNRRLAPDEATKDGPPAYQHDEPRESPTLRFSPTAWAKLLYLRDLGDTEVGGFGISAADDLLCVQDVQLVRQVCTGASVAFDDQAVAEFFDQQVDLGRVPSQFGRLWVHTHPGNFAEPSQTDEETFARVFGRTDWALMFILARQGQSYARLRFHVGPGGDVDLPVRVDYARPFAASDHTAWKEEYATNVRREEPRFLRAPAALADQDHEMDLFEPFGADCDERVWWPDLFEEMPFDMEIPHGNHA
jgi:hypothetical protein